MRASYIAQNGICWGMGQLHKLVVDFCFTLEAREVDELPECALGTASITKMPLPTAITQQVMFPRR